MTSDPLVPPIEAADAALGAALSNSEAAELVANTLRPEYMPVDRQRVVCTAVHKLIQAHRPVDALVVADVVGATGEDRTWILTLPDLCPAVSSVKEYIGTMLRYQTQLSLLQLSDELKTIAVDRSLNGTKLQEWRDRAAAVVAEQEARNLASGATLAVTTAAEPLDWQALLRNGVPAIEYLIEPWFPKGARIWIWGATGSVKSLFCMCMAADLSRTGRRVSIFSEENTVQEELRRLAKTQPDPEYFRLFHRTGMDLQDPRWIAVLLEATRGDEAVFLDSWTDLWGGDEDRNREVQQFDASVLKPLQAQGVTPIVIHHSGHRQMFSDRGGATAGRGASSLGQKADVTLEFKSAGDDRFTIVYGKCRIGGIRQGEHTFRVQDGDDGRVEIVEASSPEELAVSELVEKMVLAVQTVPAGLLTTSELRAIAGGRRERQTVALDLLRSGDDRVRVDVERQRARDGKLRTMEIWRPAGPERVGDQFILNADDGGTGTNPSPLKGGEAFTSSTHVSSNPCPESGEALGTTSTESEGP